MRVHLFFIVRKNTRSLIIDKVFVTCALLALDKLLGIFPAVVSTVEVSVFVVFFEEKMKKTFLSNLMADGSRC